MAESKQPSKKKTAAKKAAKKTAAKKKATKKAASKTAAKKKVAKKASKKTAAKKAAKSAKTAAKAAKTAKSAEKTVAAVKKAVEDPPPAEVVASGSDSKADATDVEPKAKSAAVSTPETGGPDSKTTHLTKDPDLTTLAEHPKTEEAESQKPDLQTSSSHSS